MMKVIIVALSIIASATILIVALAARESGYKLSFRNETDQVVVVQEYLILSNGTKISEEYSDIARSVSSKSTRTLNLFYGFRNERDAVYFIVARSKDGNYKDGTVSLTSHEISELRSGTTLTVSVVNGELIIRSIR